MKINFLILLGLIPALAFSQTKDSMPFNRFSIGISYSPNVSYRHLEYSQVDNWIADVRNKEEIPVFGLTTGFNLRFRLSNKVTIGSGWFYAAKGYKTRSTALYWESQSADHPISSKTEFQFQYAEIPLELNYYLRTSRASIYIATGLSMNFLINRKTTLVTKLTDGAQIETSDKQRIGFKANSYAAIIGFGVCYPLSKSFSVNVGSSYSRFLTSTNPDKAGKEFLYAIGLKASIFYRFKIRKATTFE